MYYEYYFVLCIVRWYTKQEYNRDTYTFKNYTPTSVLLENVIYKEERAINLLR